MLSQGGQHEVPSQMEERAPKKDYVSSFESLGLRMAPECNSLKLLAMTTTQSLTVGELY